MRIGCGQVKHPGNLRRADIELIREWSLITGRGSGATKREGELGASEVLPLQKGGGGIKGISHAEGSFEVVLTQEFYPY